MNKIHSFQTGELLFCFNLQNFLIIGVQITCFSTKDQNPMTQIIKSPELVSP